MRSSDDICEDLVRHVEASGSEAFEKTFVRNDQVICSVWCVIGPNAQAFNNMAKQWMADSGFTED